MVFDEALKLIGQFGLPLVIAVAMVFEYVRLRKEHKADREAWDEERRRLQGEWDEERRRIQAACDEEREAWHEEQRALWLASKQDAENMSKMLLEAHKNHASIINAANDMATAFAQEKKDIRDARDRELKDTGGHRPPRLPAR